MKFKEIMWEDDCGAVPVAGNEGKVDISAEEVLETFTSISAYTATR